VVILQAVYREPPRLAEQELPRPEKQLSRLGEDSGPAPGMEAADHDPVVTVVQQRDGEALIRSGVRKWIEPDDAHVLKTSPTPRLKGPIFGVERTQPKVHRLDTIKMPIQRLDNGPIGAVTHQPAVASRGPRDPTVDRHEHGGEECHHHGECQEPQGGEVGHDGRRSRSELERLISYRPSAGPPAGGSDSARGHMSRRTGKAATRRARQQKRTKQGPSPAAATPVPAPSPGAPDASATSADATTATVRPTAATPRSAPPAYATSSSRLGESARLEYHYVRSDLRNTGILVVIMAVLLGVAVVAVNLISAGP
jgi:hypothetical protein